MISINKEKNRKKGNSAEELACEYLIQNDFSIIKRNFSFGKIGEIDIIAEKTNVLYFIEVRSKHSSSTYDPLISIDHSKQKKIRRSAEGYLYINKITDKECRMDVIIVDLSGKTNKINHIENAI